MTDPSKRPQKRLHLVIGDPDPENCPICRAHGNAPREEAISGDESAQILIQELSAEELLRCDCPMCTEVRKKL